MHNTVPQKLDKGENPSDRVRLQKIASEEW